MEEYDLTAAQLREMASPKRKTKIPAGFKVPDSITDRVKLGEWLIKSGFRRGSEEFDELYKLLRDDFTLGY